MPLAGGPDGPLRRGEDPLIGTDQTTPAQLMAVETLSVHEGTYRLRQRPEPMISNLIVIAAAAFNHEQYEAVRTASIRVNFLRPFVAGAQSVYEATALRIGRTSAIADATAVGANEKAAVIARVTGYR